MGIDAESRLLDNEMDDKDTEALSEPFKVNLQRLLYASYMC